MKILGFHHIAMKVYDFDKSLDFYKAIGGVVVKSWGEGAERAALVDIGNGAHLELFAGGPQLPRPEGFVAHFAIRTDDTAAAISVAEAAGANVTVPAKHVTIPSVPEALPVILAFCTGPDGEVIEFFQPLD